MAKICRKCKGKKELDMFPKHKAGADGHLNTCKKCIHDYNQSRKSEISPIFYSWAGMKQRCRNKNCPEYFRYGGRGVSVCKRWMEFKNFEKDMIGGYKKGLSIERIDNNGNYEPSNCRWATPHEQAINRRSTNLVKFNGFELTLNDWARKIGVKRSTLSMRYYVYKWPIKKILTYNT